MAGPIVVSSRYRDGLSSGLGRSESRLRSFGRVAGAVGRAAAVGLGVASVAAVKLGQQSVREASAAQQSIGATESVYGKYASTVVRESRRAATEIGLSANEYRELSNQLGAMLGNTGIPLQKVTGLTEKLNERAADMAATFGGTTREAVESIAAVMRGETDPIEKYGVSIRQTDIDARLAAKGQAELEGAALKQATAQARVDLLFKQTSKSAGQFRREQGTLAGQQQILGAQVDNLQAKFGRMLLPTLVDLAQYGNSTVIPFLDRTIDQLESGQGSVGGFADGVRDLFDQIRSGEGEWGAIADGAKEIGGALADAWPDIQAAARELPSLGDGLKVTATVIGFAADNADLLAKALPFLAAGFVAMKVAQAGANVAQAASPALRLADTIATRQQTKAIKDLTIAQTSQNTAGRTASSAAVAGGYQQIGRAADQAEKKVSRLRVAGRVAGGAAGLGALAIGATSADGGMSTLLTTLGGAATGFAIGGPVGAAVGALGGLATATDTSTSAYKRNIQIQKDLRNTLDQTSGAVTEATRQTAYSNFQKDDTFDISRLYGIPDRRVIDAATGNVDALRRIRRQLDQAVSEGRLDSTYADDFMNSIRRQSRELGVNADALRKRTAATRDYSGQLKGLPPRVKTIVSETGIEPASRKLTRLARQYKLTPKQIRTLVRATGTDKVERDVKRVMRQLRETGRTRPNLRPWQRGISAGIGAGVRIAQRGTRSVDRDLSRTGGRARPNVRPWTSGISAGIRVGTRAASRGTADVTRLLSRGTSRARPDLRGFERSFGQDITGVGRDAGRGGQEISDNLRRGTSRARPDLGGFNSGVASGIATARGIASSGGVGVGGALKSGVISGFSGTASALAASAAGAVRSAIAAARAAARARSPSRETMRLGRDLGDGLRLGLEGTRKKNRAASAKLVKSILGAAASDVGALQTRLRALGKEYGAKEKRVNGVVKALLRQEKRLVANRRNVTRLTTSVQNSTRAYKESVAAQNEYAAGVRSSILEFGALTGIEEGHLNDPRALLASRKAALAEATRFDKAIRALRGQLNQADLRALVDAGPSQGLAAAEALVAGLGSGVVTEINKVQRDLSALGSGLGDRMSKDFLQAGVDAKKKIMRADQASLRTATRTGNRLASSLLRSFRRRLGVGGRRRQSLGQQILGGNGGADRRRAEQYGRELARGVRVGASREALSPRARTAQPAQRAGGGAGGKGQMVEVRLTAKDITDAMAGRQVKKWVRAADREAQKR